MYKGVVTSSPPLYATIIKNYDKIQYIPSVKPSESLVKTLDEILHICSACMKTNSKEIHMRPKDIGLYVSLRAILERSEYNSLGAILEHLHKRYEEERILDLLRGACEHYYIKASKKFRGYLHAILNKAEKEYNPKDWKKALKLSILTDLVFTSLLLHVISHNGGNTGIKFDKNYKGRGYSKELEVLIENLNEIIWETIAKAISYTFKKNNKLHQLKRKIKEIAEQYKISYSEPEEFSPIHVASVLKGYIGGGFKYKLLKEDISKEMVKMNPDLEAEWEKHVKSILTKLERFLDLL